MRALFVSRRGLRIAFFLLPVYGLQIVMVLYRPEAFIQYDIVEGVVVGTQGTIMAIAYCAINSEVRSELEALNLRYIRQRAR